MKYLFLLLIFLSCKTGSRKVSLAPNDQDTTTEKAVKQATSSIDIRNPYETGKDTIRLNKVMDKIFKFPEVQAINRQIQKTSKGKHGVSFMVRDEFNNDTSFYLFMVGDNSHEDRYRNVYNFVLDKKTGQIKAYDALLDSIMSLDDWRKGKK